MSAASALLLGFLLGLKHAVDADHLAAVSTIVSGRSDLRRSSLIGASWGLGHSLALVPMAILIVFLRIEISARMATALEIGVGVMLVGLALDSFRKLAQGETLHVHAHRHAQQRHVHPHFHAPAAAAAPEHARAPHDDDAHGLRLRPILVGLAHGLAGSAALMLLVLSTIADPALAVLYVAVFALGSTLGMVAMSLLVALPLRLTALRFAHANVALRGLAGCFSLVVGLTMLYQLAFAAG
jgi:hypothetical protein